MNSYKVINSPVGKLTLVANPTHLIAVLWEEEKEGRVKLERGEKVKSHPVLDQTEKQLNEYFLGKRNKFDLPLKFMGTEFQNAGLEGASKIPFGKTMSYGEIASKVGSPKASRAVGAANGKNPLSIVVPCHRVIGMNGKLTGFAGGTPGERSLTNYRIISKLDVTSFGGSDF